MTETVAQNTQRTSGRRGGRAERQAIRSAPLDESKKILHPGMNGGRFCLFSDAEIKRIHRAALDVLETIGMKDAIPSCIDIVCTAGGQLTDDGRLLFPRALVEDTIASARRDVTLYGRERRHDIHLAGSKIHFGTGGAAVHMYDMDTHTYRESTLQDLYDIARIVDTLEHIHFFHRSVIARDMTDPYELDINTLYTCLQGTNKHVGTAMGEGPHVAKALEMLHMVAGDEKAWRARPFVSQANCFVVPPLKFAVDACYCLEEAVRGGMPVLLLSAGQAGATAPAALAGAVVQAIAEVLVGLVYANLIVPGCPCIMGTWPFVSDLRTGAMSGGSGEQALLSAGCAQVINYYDLPSGVPAGMTDAKTPDTQHGYEKGYTTTLLAHAGSNMIYESAGMQGSLLGCSMEALVIDNDMIGSVLRTIHGIDVTEDSLSVDAMRAVCLDGQGHYLGHDQTLQLMEREYVYPDIGNRQTPKEWEEAQRPVITETARARVLEILRTHNPRYINYCDADIRAAFPIHLPAG